MSPFSTFHRGCWEILFLSLPLLPWLPIAFGAKDKVLTLAHESLCIWPLPTSWPSPLPSFYLFCSRHPSLLTAPTTHLVRFSLRAFAHLFFLCGSVFPQIYTVIGLLSPSGFLSESFLASTHKIVPLTPCPSVLSLPFFIFIFLHGTYSPLTYIVFTFCLLSAPPVECQGKAFVFLVHSCVAGARTAPGT